jgi:hypothetical protein
MEEQDLAEIEKIDISPSLMVAYLINIGKALIFMAVLAGAYSFVNYFAGTNLFLDTLNDIGIPLVWATRAAIIFFGAFLALAFFLTLSLTSYEFIFEGDTLTYSYGSFFKTTRSTPIANIIRVNFHKYLLSGLGDIELELTGTEEKLIKVQYVRNAQNQCDLINKLINLKKSDVVQNIDKEVGL